MEIAWQSSANKRLPYRQLSFSCLLIAPSSSSLPRAYLHLPRQKRKRRCQRRKPSDLLRLGTSNENNESPSDLEAPMAMLVLVLDQNQRKNLEVK